MATIAGINTGGTLLNQGPTGLAAYIPSNKSQPKTIGGLPAAQAVTSASDVANTATGGLNQSQATTTGTTTGTTAGGLPSFAPTQQQLENIRVAQSQNRNINPGDVLKVNEWYVYVDPTTGKQMKTTNQQVAQYQANLAGANQSSTGATGTTTGTTTGTGTTAGTTAGTTTGTNTGTTIQMDPTIGTWAQIAGVGTGFNYDPFTYNDINSLGSGYGYEDYLTSINPYSETVRGPSQNTLNIGYGGTNLANQFYGNQNQVNKLDTYTPFTYTDQATQSAVNALDTALERALFTTTYNPFGQTSNTTLNFNRLDPEIKVLVRGNDIEIGRSGVSMLDAINDTQRNSILAKVSASTGIPADQLTKLYNDYHYANKTFFDPSGTGFADLMSSGAAQDVLTGIGEWSGRSQNIEEANAILGREGVAKEFADRDFGVTAENPIREITDSSGNKFYAVYNGVTGTQFIARDQDTANQIVSGQGNLTYDEDTGMFYGQKDTGEYIDAAYYYLNKTDERGNFTGVNKLLTVDDFLPAGVTIRTATPEQLASAQAALDGQRELMQTWKDPYSFTTEAVKTHTKNPYNLTEDSDPLKKQGRYFFINDATGEVVSVKDKNVATWAADDVANDAPLFYKGKYYYIDKDDGSIRSTNSEFIANGESAIEGYLSIRDWRKLLPAGVTEATATAEQIAQAQSDLATLQQNLIDLTGEGTVFNLFKSENLPIPEDFYYDPERITRDFNTLVNMGIDPRTIDPSLTPENVYKKSLEYDAPDSGFGSFVSGIILPALSIAYPQLAPFLQGLSGAYQLSQGNIMGALTSFAGATGFMKEIFGGEGVMAGFRNNLSNTLQSNFGLSADVANNLVDTGVWAGGSAVVAALNDQNVLEALARGAGEQYLRNTISGYLAESIPNESVRNFITQRLTDSTMNALRGGNVNFEQLLTNAFASGLFSDMSTKTRATNP